MEHWIGKVAVVTGAGRGIGAAIIKTFVEKGIIAVGLDIREDLLKDVAVRVHRKIYVRKCDISNVLDVESSFDWIEKTLGGVDILVNCAGVLIPGSLINGSTDNYVKIITVNTLGLSYCTKEALKTMRQRGDDGYIIHINSVAGHRVHQKTLQLPLSMYTASKYAVTALTESLRLELSAQKSKIRVTGINPGEVNTVLYHHFFDIMKGIKEEQPLPAQSDDILCPQDIADAVIFCIGTKPAVQIKELTITTRGKNIGDVK